MDTISTRSFNSYSLIPNESGINPKQWVTKGRLSLDSVEKAITFIDGDTRIVSRFSVRYGTIKMRFKFVEEPTGDIGFAFGFSENTIEADVDNAILIGYREAQGMFATVIKDGVAQKEVSIPWNDSWTNEYIYMSVEWGYNAAVFRINDVVVAKILREADGSVTIPSFPARVAHVLPSGIETYLQYSVGKDFGDIVFDDPDLSVITGDYDYGTVTMTDIQSDFSVAENSSMLGRTRYVVSLKPDKTCTVKFNSTDTDPITLAANTERVFDHAIAVSDIFVTTTETTNLVVLAF